MDRPDPYDFEERFYAADRLDELFVPVFMVICLAGILWIVFEVVILILG